MGRNAAVKILVLAATTAGLIFLGAAAAHADDSQGSTGDSPVITVTTPSSPRPSVDGNNPWD